MSGDAPRTGTFSRRGFKNSLRKMPSSFFARDGKATVPGSESRPTPRPARSKRKGLASILGFGSGRFANAPPLPQPTGSLRSRGRGSVRFGSAEPQTKPRPSCGPDPFYRQDDGARIVRPTTSVQDLERRVSTIRSISDSPTRPTGTCGITVVSIDALDDIDDPLNTTSDETSHDSSASSNDSHPLLSTPSSHRHTFGRASSPPQMVPLVEVDETVTPAENIGASHSVDQKQVKVPTQTLKKGKYKSRVWGMFSSRRKNRTVTTGMGATAARTSRPPVPSVHVTHPSMDSSVRPTKEPFSDHGSIGAKCSFPAEDSFVVLQPSDESMSVGHDGFGSTQRPLPKRKSLTGLFGLALKKSQGRLRVTTPSPSRNLKVAKDAAPPCTPPRATLKVPDASSGDVSSGRPVSDSFMDEGTLLGPDVSIGQVTSNDDQPQLSVNDTAHTPSRLSFFRSTPKRPSPVNTEQPAMAPQRLAASTNPSPSGGDTPRKSLLNALSNRKDGQMSAPTTPKTPSLTPSPIRSMVKRGMKNIFAPPSPAAQAISSGWPLALGHREILIKSRTTEADVPTTTTSSSSINSDRVFTVHPGYHPSTSSKGRRPGALSPQLRPRLSKVPVATNYLAGSKPPKLSLEFERSSRHSSFISESWFPPSVQRNGNTPSQRSFSFDQQLTGLDVGAAPRSSFLQAISLAPPLDVSDSSPCKPLLELRADYPRRTSEKSLASKGSNQDDRTLRLVAGTPFQGQLAFQKFVEQTKPSLAPETMPTCTHPPFALPVPPPPRTLPVPPVARHRKGDSAVSLASISSLGAPFDIPSRDYPNYFDLVFGPSLPSLPTLPQSIRQQSALPRAAKRGTRHHRHRSSSDVSVESAEISRVSGSVDMRNRSRASLVRPIRYSVESTIGHRDWASQRCQSPDSVVNLGRPGLGDRMFHIDKDVELKEVDGTLESNVDAARLSYASEWSSCDPRSESDSLFASVEEQDASSFWLKGQRPLSDVSDMSSTANVSDTFHGHGCPSHGMESPVAIKSRSNSVFQPTRSRRAKPPLLNISEPEIDTPGLTSPSSIEDSSLFSFETKISHPPLLNLARSRSHHCHGNKTSIASGVQIQPTIREESSLSTLLGAQMAQVKPLPPSLGLPSTALEMEDSVENYGEWYDKRDGLEVSATEPQTPDELEAFLHKPSQIFQPQQAQQAPGRHALRRPTFKMTRASTSPCAMALPPLVTRYQNKRGSASSEDGEASVISPLLTEFARDTSTSPMPTPVEDKTATKVSDFSHEKAAILSSTRSGNLDWGRHCDSDPLAPKEILEQPKSTSAAQETFPSFLSFSPQQRTQPLDVKPAPTIKVAGEEKLKRTGKDTRPRVSSRPRPPSVGNKHLTKLPSSAPLSPLPMFVNQPARVQSAKETQTVRPKSVAGGVAADKPKPISKVKSSPEALNRAIPSKPNTKNM